MSAHLSRGIFQSATYVYSAGFAFTSDVCAPACPAHPADIVNAHTAAKPFHTFPFMSFFLRKLGQDLRLVFLAHRSVQGIVSAGGGICARVPLAANSRWALSC